MDAHGLPLIGSSVDYSKVDAINQKKTLSFINHFVMHTSGFLNRFSSVCEEKLSHLSVRIQRLETQMKLLEGKLSSIPGLDQVTTPSTVTPQQGQSTQQQTTTAGSQQTPKETQPVQVPTSKPPDQDKQVTDNAAPPEQPTETVSRDPRYAKFFKMKDVGVPAAALKQKMLLEGLNPDMLDTPNAPLPSNSAPNAPLPTSSTPNVQDKDSDSDFSDEDKVDEEASDDSVEFSD